MAEIPVSLPKPRHRLDAAFRAMVDRCQCGMSAAGRQRQRFEKPKIRVMRPTVAVERDWYEFGFVSRSRRNAETTLRTIIGWGRYAELFSYNDRTRMFGLDNSKI